MEEKKVLLSVQDLVVKFKVRGRSLTAIRGISLDIYDGESIAIVGESGSGKSVFTKTFANMLDSNGYVDSGKIIFNDPDLAEVTLDVGHKEDVRMTSIRLKLDAYSKLEHGADTYKAMKALEAEKKAKRAAEIAAREEAKRAEREGEGFLRDRFLRESILVPVLLHGFWDFSLSVDSPWMTAAFYAFVLVFFLSANHRLRAASEDDQQL